MKRNDDYEWVLNGLNRGDGSLEKILFNLDGLQSRVLSLKTQLSEVMSENIRDISRSATNFLREDPHIGYARSLSCSPPGNNGDAMPHHRLSEYELEVPESAVSSYGDAADVDTIECTVGLLSADAPLHQRQERDFYKDVRLLHVLSLTLIVCPSRILLRIIEPMIDQSSQLWILFGFLALDLRVCKLTVLFPLSLISL